MKTNKVVVLDTEYKEWNPRNPGDHYSVVIRCLARENNIWRFQIKSHEVDTKLGWTGNYQTHTDEIALDGLQRAVAHRKSERQHRRHDRARSRRESERFERFEAFLKSRGFVTVEPKKKTTALTYRRSNLTVRKMWHGGWRIEGNGPSQIERSLDAVEATISKITDQN